MKADVVTPLIMLLLCAGVLIGSLLLGVNDRDQSYLPLFSSQPVPEICPFKRATGHDCAGCGLTRSIVSVSHGEWQRAWQFHRVGFAIYLFILAQLLHSSLNLLRARCGRPLLRWRWLEYSGYAIVALLILNWIWNLVQLVRA